MEERLKTKNTCVILRCLCDSLGNFFEAGDVDVWPTSAASNRAANVGDGLPAPVGDAAGSTRPVLRWPFRHFFSVFTSSFVPRLPVSFGYVPFSATLYRRGLPIGRRRCCGRGGPLGGGRRRRRPVGAFGGAPRPPHRRPLGARFDGDGRLRWRHLSPEKCSFFHINDPLFVFAMAANSYF